MPLYEFKCEACGKQFEELIRSMTERRRPKCPRCRSPRVRKCFSTFAMSGTSRSRASANAGAGGGCATCSGGSCATCGR
ncbi:MAG: zinc ribbon domain-containing protein [Planctomycetes bacterium]|nr:zinc ribbon domain-containing protein [Planctomycetota bacterium]